MAARIVKKPHKRNDGISFEADLFNNLVINKSAIERRAASLTKRRSIKKQWQAAWLLKAISCIDLTTLAGDDTNSNVARLCAKARNPLRTDLLQAMDMADNQLQVGAVCVYHKMIPSAVAALEGSGLSIAAVSTGFPLEKLALARSSGKSKLQ